MAYFGENWDDADFPLAYLITIRTYGTWLHGDDRYSVDTHSDYNVFGMPRRPKNPNLQKVMTQKMKGSPFVLDDVQRRVVHEAIQEVCRHREYTLHAVNVRTNHAHAVISTQVKPEKVADSFKAYATRNLRRKHLINDDIEVWSRGRSRRYLWKSNHVSAAINYVLYCQGDEVFDDWYGARFDG
jgi:REP element-mobilizing transposase RayT